MPHRPTGGDGSGEDQPVDRDLLRTVLRRHPVRTAVLFGSQVTQEGGAERDVDVAIELDEDVSDPATVYMDVLRDLSVELDRNDVDLSLVDDLKPRVGVAAFERGERLVGSPERVRALRERFVQEASESRSSQSLRERLDGAIERVDELVEGDA